LSSFSSTYTYYNYTISTRSVSDSGASVLGITIQFNGDTTSGNYSWKRLYGDGSSAASDSLANIILSNSDSSTASTDFVNTQPFTYTEYQTHKEKQCQLN
jgi:hypothetical protein